MIDIAVLASGRGTNFQSIINSIKRNECNANINLLITDNPNAEAIKRAKRNDIPVEIKEEERKEKEDKNTHKREELDIRIKESLDDYKVDLVVLAGYMKVIKLPELLDSYQIINIHPSLLPAFPGLNAQKKAFEYGVKVSGVTIHFVTEDLDSGPIIDQRAVRIDDCKTVEEVEQKILKEEHKLYPKVIDSFDKGEYMVKDGKVYYEEEDSNI